MKFIIGFFGTLRKTPAEFVIGLILFLSTSVYLFGKENFNGETFFFFTFFYWAIVLMFFLLNHYDD